MQPGAAGCWELGAAGRWVQRAAPPSQCRAHRQACLAGEATLPHKQIAHCGSLTVPLPPPLPAPGAEVLAELLRREQELGITPDPEVDAYMRATALGGKGNLIGETPAPPPAAAPPLPPRAPPPPPPGRCHGGPAGARLPCGTLTTAPPLSSSLTTAPPLSSSPHNRQSRS